MTKAEKEALKNGFISQWYHAAMLMKDVQAEKKDLLPAAQNAIDRAIGAKYLAEDILKANPDYEGPDVWVMIRDWAFEAEAKAGFSLHRF